MPVAEKSFLMGHNLSPAKTYEEVLSNPQLVKQSWVIWAIVNKVWEAEELSADEWDTFKEMMKGSDNQKLFRAHLNERRNEG